MGANSAIEWTDATWNPVTGCTKITRGCDNCYAARFAERWRGVTGHPYEQGFDLRVWPSRLDQPARWRKPRMIFVNSMSDLFHKRVERHFIDQVFDTMETANRHVYQILTKRSSLMRSYGTGTLTVWLPITFGAVYPLKTTPLTPEYNTYGKLPLAFGSSRSNHFWVRLATLISKGYPGS